MSRCFIEPKQKAMLKDMDFCNSRGIYHTNMENN